MPNATPRTGLAKSSEVANYLGTTENGLAKWRWEGKGPQFIRMGGRSVRYRWEDVDQWLQDRTVTK